MLRKFQEQQARATGEQNETTIKCISDYHWNPFLQNI